MANCAKYLLQFTHNQTGAVYSFAARLPDNIHAFIGADVAKARRGV